MRYDYDKTIKILKDRLADKPEEKRRLQRALGYDRFKMSKVLNGHIKLSATDLLTVAAEMPDNPFKVVIAE